MLVVRELAIDHAVHLQAAQRLRYERNAQAGGNEVESRDDARRFLSNVWTEAGPAACGDDRVVQTGAAGAFVQDERFGSEIRQRKRRRATCSRLSLASTAGERMSLR